MKAPKNPNQAKTFWQRVSANRFFLIIMAILVGVLVWQLLSASLGLPNFILPSPRLVLEKFSQTIQSGLLWRHFSYTLLEVMLGLMFGSLSASLLGYFLSKSPRAERFLSPYLVASQSIPIVAIAPLLVIWFGPGLFSKVLICGLVVFFPVLVNTLVGLREVPQNLHDLMRSLQASPRQTLRYLEFPASLPVFLAGLRVGATLSVIGAIVGELVGSDRGLGFLINVGRGQFDTAMVFVAVITLMFLASSLYAFILLLETRLLAWQTWRKDL